MSSTEELEWDPLSWSIQESAPTTKTDLGLVLAPENKIRVMGKCFHNLLARGLKRFILTTIHWLLYVPLLYLTHILNTHHYPTYSSPTCWTSQSRCRHPLPVCWPQWPSRPPAQSPRASQTAKDLCCCFLKMDVLYSLIICQVWPIVVSRIVSPEEDTVKSSPL